MKLSTALLLTGVLAVVVVPVLAKERRAKPEKFGMNSFRGLFFDDLSTVVDPSRPDVKALRGIKPGGGKSTTVEEESDEQSSGQWKKLASAQSIEDEIKRQKLLFDSEVAQPGPFKSGGYVNARNELSIMATLFSVVSMFEGDIRWKEESVAARNLLARSAGNCNSGDIAVYKECTTRKQDLDDLLSGSSISSPPAADESRWSMIADRSILMDYLDSLSNKHLPDLTNTDDGVKDSPERVKQFSDMVALVGHILTQEGMDDADDEEYAKLSKQMRDAAILVGEAAMRGDADGARKGVGAINQSCDACHEQYR
ncbi:MAG: cytochrome c [Pirellulaceae bacterium]